MKSEKKEKVGRPLMEKLKVQGIYIPFRINGEEQVEFDRLMSNSGAKNRTEFIKACIFNKTLKVVKIDKVAFDYWRLLNNLQAQYRAIGNNYNQNTKALKSAFEEKKALAFVYKLEQATIELVKLNQQIIQLTIKFEDEWLRK